MPFLSVVLPIYNEQDNIEPVIEEIRAVMKAHSYSYEILAIDDGSRDGSLDVLGRLAGAYPELRVYSFRRNQGQSAAFDAGFRLARGRVIITMDADGQNDPADIPRLMEEIRNGADFVTGRRTNRQDGLFLRRIPSRIANWLIRKVTSTRVSDLGCSLKAYRKEITGEIFLYGEMHRFVSVLAESIGARVSEIDVNHRPRQRGISKYSVWRTFKVVLDLITVWFFLNFHTKPIYVFGGLGITSATMSAGMAAYVLYQKYAFGFFVHRNPLFIISAILLVFAVQFLVFGLLAEILVRTYFESQNKRPYSFKQIFNGTAECAAS